MAKTSNSKKIVLVLSALFVVGLAGATTYLFIENKDLKQQALLSENEKQKIRNDGYIEDIGKLMSLPEEEPFYQISVNDPEKAISENPEFKLVFDTLEKDDFILIYKNAKLGIQYRPSENKIIKTNTIKLPVIVELVGSEDAIAEAEKNITAKFGPEVVIIKKVDDTVKQAFIYDVDNNQESDIKIIAEQLGLEIGSTLPTSITPSDQTEIVIVVVPSSATPTTP